MTGLSGPVRPVLDCEHEPNLINGWSDHLTARDGRGVVTVAEYARMCRRCGASLIRFRRGYVDGDGFPTEAIDLSPWFVTKPATPESAAWAAQGVGSGT